MSSEPQEARSAATPSSAYTYSVTKDGGWLFGWAFRVFDSEGEMVYGEQHIESKRAATRDAEDLVARLSDGRIWIHATSGLIHA